jgi:hypothetical protein
VTIDETSRVPLSEAVKGDRRTQLEAIRDHIAHELEANLCKTCENSRLRTGDQASLILRLQTVLAEIEALPEEGKVNRLASITGILDGGSDAPPVPLSGKSAVRRAGNRKPGGGRYSAG